MLSPWLYSRVQIARRVTRKRRLSFLTSSHSSAVFRGSISGALSKCSHPGKKTTPSAQDHSDDILMLIGCSYYATLTHPFRIKLFSKEFYIIQGQESQTSTSHTIFNAAFLRQACDMSEHAVQRFGSEDEETPKYSERKYLAAAPLYLWSSSVIHRYLAGRTAFQLAR